MSTEGGMKAVVAALLANLGIAVSKFVAFLFTGSSSMLSEAIHSVADSGNQVLLLVGNKRSKKQADEHHKFGYGRRRYVYGFVVAIVLFLVGGLFSLYEGWHKWQHPEPLNDWWIAVVVLLVAIVLESFSFRTAIREANHSRGRRSMAKFVRDARQPELPGDPARGCRRPRWAWCSRCWAWGSPSSPATAASTRWAPWRSARCSWSSRSSSRWR